MGTIIINGKTIKAEGKNVTIRNDKVYVDGKLVEEGLSGIVEVKWEGPMASLTADGNVTCGEVLGNVSAGGSVQCADVDGYVNAGGSVSCGTVGGSINAGGSVRHR